jgi:23S rRNA pseudouridine1911/1915/1917 synthase
VRKVYAAILCGELPRESGEIRAAIARHPSHRKRMAATDDDDGRAAHTSYQLIERLNAATLVDAQIHTGRTHQIRVHFQFIGYPLVGDDTYGARPNARLKELANYAAPRVMLHARDLSFEHPLTKETVSFTAPLPADFKDALKFLRLKKKKSKAV